MKDTRNDKSTLIVVLVQIIIIIGILGILRINEYKKHQNDDFENEVVYEEKTDTQEKEDSTKGESESTSTIYEAPNYDFKSDEVIIELDNLDREYTIAWVSDLHLVTDIEKAKDIKIEFVNTLTERYEMFITDDGVYAKELWPEIVKYLNYGKYDAILFGGDMIDYCSEKNLAYFSEYYNQLNPEIPILYVRSDHDYGTWYGREEFTDDDARVAHQQLFRDQDNDEKKVLEFENFDIIGINKSYMNITENSLSRVENMISKAKSNNKSVIIMTHVPYESKVDLSLSELSMKVRSTKYYWLGDNYQPNNDMEKYLNEMIYGEDTSITNVVAGHLHASWDGMLTNSLSQHIFAPAYRGYIGIIHVVPKK